MLKLFSAFLIILLSSKSVAMGDQFYAERSGMDIYSKEVNGKILWDILANYTVKNSEYVGGIKINGFGYRTSYGQDTFRINDFCPEDTPNRATVCFSINRTRYNIDGEKDRFDKYLEQQDVTKLNQLEWFCGFLANNFNEFIIWSKETAANPEYVTDKELAPKLVDFFVAEQTEYEIFGRNCLSAVINAKSKKKEQVAEGTDTNQLLAKSEEIWDLQKKVNELSETLTTTEGSLQKLRDYSATQLKKMRTEASELQRKNDRLQNKVSQLESTAENLRNENKKLQNVAINDDKSEPAPSTNVDVEYLIKEKSRLGAEKYELSRKLFEVYGELAASESKLRQLEANLGLAVSDKDKSADQLNLSRQREAELRQSISELQNNINQRELELAKIKKRLATSEAENTSLSVKALNDSRILSGRISKLQSDKVDLQNSLSETSKQRDESDRLVSYLSKELAEAKTRMNAHESEKGKLIAQISNERQRLNKQIYKLQSEKLTLQNSIEQAIKQRSSADAEVADLQGMLEETERKLTVSDLKNQELTIDLKNATKQLRENENTRSRLSELEQVLSQNENTIVSIEKANKALEQKLLAAEDTIRKQQIALSFDVDKCNDWDEPSFWQLSKDIHQFCLNNLSDFNEDRNFSELKENDRNWTILQFAVHFKAHEDIVAGILEKDNFRAEYLNGNRKLVDTELDRFVRAGYSHKVIRELIFTDEDIANSSKPSMLNILKTKPRENRSRALGNIISGYNTGKIDAWMNNIDNVNFVRELIPHFNQYLIGGSITGSLINMLNTTNSGSHIDLLTEVERNAIRLGEMVEFEQALKASALKIFQYEPFLDPEPTHKFLEFTYEKGVRFDSGLSQVITQDIKDGTTKGTNILNPYTFLLKGFFRGSGWSYQLDGSPEHRKKIKKKLEIIDAFLTKKYNNDGSIAPIVIINEPDKATSLFHILAANGSKYVGVYKKDKDDFQRAIKALEKEFGVDVNAKTKNGLTALEILEQTKNEPIWCDDCANVFLDFLNSKTVSVSTETKTENTQINNDNPKLNRFINQLEFEFIDFTALCSSIQSSKRTYDCQCAFRKINSNTRLKALWKAYAAESFLISQLGDDNIPLSLNRRLALNAKYEGPDDFDGMLDWGRQTRDAQSLSSDAKRNCSAKIKVKTETKTPPKKTINLDLGANFDEVSNAIKEQCTNTQLSSDTKANLIALGFDQERVCQCKYNVFRDIVDEKYGRSFLELANAGELFVKKENLLKQQSALLRKTLNSMSDNDQKQKQINSFKLQSLLCYGSGYKDYMLSFDSKSLWKRPIYNKTQYPETLTFSDLWTKGKCVAGAYTEKNSAGQISPKKAFLVRQELSGWKDQKVDQTFRGETGTKDLLQNIFCR